MNSSVAWQQSTFQNQTCPAHMLNKSLTPRHGMVCQKTHHVIPTISSDPLWRTVLLSPNGLNPESSWTPSQSVRRTVNCLQYLSSPHNTERRRSSRNDEGILLHQQSATVPSDILLFCNILNEVTKALKNNIQQQTQLVNALREEMYTFVSYITEAVNHDNSDVYIHSSRKKIKYDTDRE